MRHANILLSICKEVLLDCRAQKNAPTEEFITFFVKLAILDPVWNVSLYADEIVRVNVQNFIKHAVLKLNHPNCPCMITLRMQLYLQTSIDRLKTVALDNRMQLSKRLAPLLEDITDGLAPETLGEIDSLYEKIVHYITLSEGLGNPTITLVFNEAKQALLSVMELNDLTEFGQQSPDRRMQTLFELASLVTGVRLFNRDCKKGGRSIDDLPSLLTTSVKTIRAEINHVLDLTLHNINVFTSSLEECLKTEWIEEHIKNHVIFYELPEGIEYEDFEYTKDGLITYRQYELNLRKYLKEVDKLEDRINCCIAEFVENLSEVHKVVDLKYAVLTDTVFPKFKACAHVWHRLQCETICLAKINQIHLEMRAEMKNLIPNEYVLTALLGPADTLTASDRLKATRGLRVQGIPNNAIEPDGVKLIHPQAEDIECGIGSIVESNGNEERHVTARSSALAYGKKIKLEYLGFCAWKFVETQGALIPGHPHLGIMWYKNRYYSFSSVESGEAFAREPHKFVSQALEICRKKPELINLLDTEEQVQEVQNIKLLYKQKDPLKVSHVVETQTEMHPNDGFIDPTYMWNVWDHKRKAISMANIASMVTRSTQTEKSNNRNAVRIQTYGTKLQETQTKTDNYSNVPTLSNFVYGLRGRKDDKQFVIELTQPIEEK